MKFLINQVIRTKLVPESVEANETFVNEKKIILLKSETEDRRWTFELFEFSRKTHTRGHGYGKIVIIRKITLKGKITDEQLEAIKDIENRNQDVFSRHKVVIKCCNFVEISDRARGTGSTTQRRCI